MKSRGSLLAYISIILFLFISPCPARAAIVFTAETPSDKKADRARPETDIVLIEDSGAEKVITARPPGKALFALNAHPAVSTDGRKIAFSSYRVFFDENLKIWKDWNGEPCTIAYGKQITEEDFVYGYAYYPSRQYYASMLSRNWNVFIYDVKNGKEKQVTFFKWDEGEPSFIGRTGSVLYSLLAEKSSFMIKTAGGKRGFKQVTLQDNEVVRPDITKDGRFLVFQSYLDGNWEIYTLRMSEVRNEKIKTRLTRTSLVSELYPKWSPDGKSVVYAANSAPGGFFDLYVMDVATRQSYKLTKSGRVDGDFAFSPDGKKIAYANSTAKHGPEIHVINRDGTGDKNVSGTKGDSRMPVWSPDGTKLAFISDADGTPGLYTVSADGSNMKRASKRRAAWDRPVWFNR